MPAMNTAAMKSREEAINEAIRLMNDAIGTYSGQGVNHEGESFTDSLRLTAAIPAKLLSLEASAIGKAGEVYHREVTSIGKDIGGVLTMFVSSNNHPGVTPHVFDRIEETAYAKNIVFRFGDPSIRDSFREEITLSVFSDGTIAHHYAWGMPGGDFAPRSGATLKRLSKQN